MRLFVGLWPPSPVAAVLESLARPAHDGLRWTTADQWHVTLRFLGEVPDSQVPELRAALAAVATARAAPVLEAGPAVERLGRTALVVPVTGAEELAADVHEATAGYGDPPEPRPFRGHLTLARGRGGRPVPGRLAGNAVSAIWIAGEMALVRSTLDPAGARYETIGSFPFVDALS